MNFMVRRMKMRKLFFATAVAILILGCGSPQETKEAASQAGPAVTQAQKQAILKVVEQKQDALIQEGIEHLQDAEIRQAIESFDNAIRQNPMDPEPYLILSQTYMRLQNYLRAVDTLSAAERIAPNRGDIQYLLAISYGMLGKQDMAKTCAQKSIEFFRQSKDEENFIKSVALLQGMLEVK